MEEYKKMWKNFAVFSGRSTVRDYWMAVLFNFVIALAIGVLKLGVLASLYSVATIIPSLALLVRRLHDTNKSAWYILVSFIPVVGWIIMLIFLCQKSVDEGNNYGEVVE